MNHQDKSGCRTALIRASEDGHAKIVQMLLKHKNIDVNQQDNNGNTALIWAVARDQEEIVAILLQDERINKDLQNNEGQSALVIALIVRESKRQS